MASAAALPGNGFRRRNQPGLVYRYFRDMAACLSTVRSLVRPGAPVCMVVGSNKTTLGGQDFIIDTPGLLADVAAHIGYGCDGLIRMDTYPRYDLHQQNSINDESLIILRA